MVFYQWTLYHGTFCIKTVQDFDVKWHNFDTILRWARRSFGTFPTSPSSENLRSQSRWYLNGDAMSNFRQLGHAQSWMGSKASFLAILRKISFGPWQNHEDIERPHLPIRLKPSPSVFQSSKYCEFVANSKFYLLERSIIARKLSTDSRSVL